MERPKPRRRSASRAGDERAGAADGKSEAPAAKARKSSRTQATRPSGGSGAATAPVSEAQAPTPSATPSTAPSANPSTNGSAAKSKDWRKPENRRGSARRGGRRRRKAGEAPDKQGAKGSSGSHGPQGTAGAAAETGGESQSSAREKQGEPRHGGGQREKSGRTSRGKSRFNKRGRHGDARGGKDRRRQQRDRGGAKPSGEVEGLLVLEHKNHGHVRRAESQFMPNRKEDVHVAPRLVQRYALREGSLIQGRYGRGQGKHRYDMIDVDTVDGRPASEVRNLVGFKNLTSIDPDFHYAMGDLTGDVSLRIVDLICPVGRGQRGLIVAPPRTGKTVLLQKISRAIEEHYTDVHLMVLLVDERPEEATEWRRTIERGQVFVSTNDELPSTHVDLAEMVWKRARRLVELGEDVFLVIDSITRLARAYNNLQGPGGRTMSGGVDTRTMEKPKQFFGSARNTETAGSLTILGTTLIETGSRMDQVIFEEFKGTGNMELVLSRKLADRRIFPAIDLQRSGTRKEEKLISSRKLKLITTLRRVLMRMNFIEAMELLATKLDDIETNEEFLSRFEIDPEA